MPSDVGVEAVRRAELLQRRERDGQLLVRGRRERRDPGCARRRRSRSSGRRRRRPSRSRSRRAPRAPARAAWAAAGRPPSRAAPARAWPRRRSDPCARLDCALGLGGSSNGSRGPSVSGAAVAENRKAMVSLHDRIDAVLRAPGADHDVDELERLLTDGYAEALSLEAETVRLEKRLDGCGARARRRQRRKGARALVARACTRRAERRARCAAAPARASCARTPSRCASARSARA